MPQDTISEPQGPLGSSLGDLTARIEALEKSGQWWPGMIAWTASSVAPQGFLIADGSTFDGDRYAALAAAIGSTTLPNLIDSFPVGAGGLYPLLTNGGAASVTLTAAQSGVAAHTHTTGAGSAHTHTVGNEAAHTHGSPVGGNYAFTGFVAQVAAGGAFAAVNNASATTAAGSSHTHTLTSESAHTHAVNANSAAAASQAHSVLNPYVALTPIIHI